MADLGVFEAAVAEAVGEPDTFTLAGERFAAAFPVPGMLFLKVGAAGSGALEDSHAVGAVYQLFEACLGADEYARFERHTMSTDVSVETLIQLAIAIFQARAGRPTEEPSGSSPGLSATSPQSSSESSDFPELSPVLSTAERVARMRPVESPLTG